MADMKACVVCGLGSHREDWVKKGPGYVACDNHTQAEIDIALDAQKPIPAPIPLKAPTTLKPQATQAPTTASVPAIGATPNTPKTNTPAPGKTGVVGSGTPVAPTPPTPISGAAKPAISKEKP